MTFKKLHVRMPSLSSVLCSTLLAPPLLAGIACGGNKQPPQNVQPAATVPAKPASGFRDTIEITGRCAVFFQPAAQQWQQIRNVTDTMVFSSMQHDCFYQQRNARQVLQTNYPHIKIIEANRVRYLNFHYAGGRQEIIDLDGMNDACGIYLFNGVKKPLPADMMNIETELGFYFQQGA